MIAHVNFNLHLFPRLLVNLFFGRGSLGFVLLWVAYLHLLSSCQFMRYLFTIERHCHVSCFHRKPRTPSLSLILWIFTPGLSPSLGSVPLVIWRQPYSPSSCSFLTLFQLHQLKPGSLLNALLLCHLSPLLIRTLDKGSYLCPFHSLLCLQHLKQCSAQSKCSIHIC